MGATGLFLGAGASFESGMPLVWDLSAEIRAWLTAEKLQALNEGWRLQGGGHPDVVVNALVSSLQNRTMHYENMLGNLEVQFKRPSIYRQSFHEIYSWLIELVYHLLYYRHVHNEAFFERSLRYLEGIAGLARQSSPLWIFSLNHDLIVECIAALYGARLDCGLSGSGILPLRNDKGVRLGDLPVQTLPLEHLEKTGLDFQNMTHPGINLIKIHGALDVFTTNDGNDLVKLAPIGTGISGVLKSLRSANENLLYYDPAFPNGRAKAVNEIIYADEAGVMQFLRKTLLSGAFKFDRHSTQILPHAFLKQFQAQLVHVSHLVCIGYGCGDTHINQIMREWLEFTRKRKIEFVGPGITSLPPFLGHVANQVILRDDFATDYLERYAMSPLSFGERMAKAGLRAARARQRKSKGFA